MSTPAPKQPNVAVFVRPDFLPVRIPSDPYKKKDVREPAFRADSILEETLTGLKTSDRHKLDAYFLEKEDPTDKQLRVYDKPHHLAGMKKLQQKMVALMARELQQLSSMVYVRSSGDVLSSKLKSGSKDFALEMARMPQIQYGFQLPAYVTDDILTDRIYTAEGVQEKPKSLELQTLAFARWVQVAKACYDAGDYPSASGIITALNGPPIFRLKLLANTSHSDQLIFDYLLKQFTSTNSSTTTSAYRVTTEGPCIPMAGEVFDRARALIGNFLSDSFFKGVTIFALGLNPADINIEAKISNYIQEIALQKFSGFFSDPATLAALEQRISGYIKTVLATLNTMEQHLQLSPDLQEINQLFSEDSGVVKAAQSFALARQINLNTASSEQQEGYETEISDFIGKVFAKHQDLTEAQQGVCRQAITGYIHNLNEILNKAQPEKILRPIEKDIIQLVHHKLGADYCQHHEWAAIQFPLATRAASMAHDMETKDENVGRSAVGDVPLSPMQQDLLRLPNTNYDANEANKYFLACSQQQCPKGTTRELTSLLGATSDSAHKDQYRIFSSLDEKQIEAWIAHDPRNLLQHAESHAAVRRAQTAPAGRVVMRDGPGFFQRQQSAGPRPLDKAEVKGVEPTPLANPTGSVVLSPQQPK